MRLFGDGRKKRVNALDAVKGDEEDGAIFSESLDALLTVCHNNLPSVDDNLISRAFRFAWEAHKPQKRKSGEPYITHPYAVAMIVAQEIPIDDVSVAAALLHDVLEDRPDSYDYERVQKEFGSTIADIVDGVTKIGAIARPPDEDGDLHTPEQTGAAQKVMSQAETYRKLLVSLLKDVRVILVKFADRLHNMRTLDHVPPQKQRTIARETIEIYAPLANRFGLGRLKWELEDLSFKYLHPEDYRALSEQVALKRRDREEYIARFCRPIIEELKRNGLNAEVSGRPKHLYSIYRKMVKQNKTIDEIYDLFAVRIILDTAEEKDCYLAYAIVCELFIPIPERYKNFIAVPKQNGYKSLHTTVLGPEGKMVEVQIRTRHMHEIDEKGIAAHWAYKENIRNNQSAFDNWIRWVREFLETPIATGPGEEGARELIDDFKSNLYQDEIVVITPKGDLIPLPKNATPVDFAFAIHSEIGIHTIGAKVDHRIVPLNTRLRSGDRVEVITSRNQYLSPDWEQFVVTHRAKAAIKKFASEQAKINLQKGREKWERKLKRLKMHVRDEDVLRAAQRLKHTSPSRMFIALGNDELTVEDILHTIEELSRKPELPPVPTRSSAEVFEEYARIAREDAMIIQGERSDIQYDFARCCNPLPGDDVVGFVTQGRGIKIHRRNCRNIQRLLADTGADSKTMRDRLIEITWPKSGSGEYLGGVRIEGDDRPGVLNEITLAISSYNNTNIRSVNIETIPSKAAFQGSVLVAVRDLDHLERLIDRIKKVKGVSIAERYVDVT